MEDGGGHDVLRGLVFWVSSEYRGYYHVVLESDDNVCGIGFCLGRQMICAGSRDKIARAVLLS